MEEEKELPENLFAMRAPEPVPEKPQLNLHQQRALAELQNSSLKDLAGEEQTKVQERPKNLSELDY